jgi:hypothetical protein
MVDISFSAAGRPTPVRGPIPDSESVPAGYRKCTTVRRSTSADVVRITVTIRENESAQRASIALVTKSTRVRRAERRPKEFSPVAAMFRRRQIWVPTWWAALLIAVAVAASSLVALRHLGGYLAPEAPAPGRDGQGARTLIVEGWLDEDSLDAAIAVIGRGGYRRVVVSGGPIDGWREGQSWSTYAERAADYLRRHGATAIPVAAAAAPETAQDRTFVSAVVVRDWLRGQGGNIDAVDLFSGGVHARRSRLVYRMAFGPEVEVGVFAAPPRRYALEHWWTTSEGAKGVLSEAIALAWTTCCFAPPAPDRASGAAPKPPA